MQEKGEAGIGENEVRRKRRQQKKGKKNTREKKKRKQGHYRKVGTGGIVK